MAQLAEQLIRNQQVVGSIPTRSSMRTKVTRKIQQRNTKGRFNDVFFFDHEAHKAVDYFFGRQPHQFEGWSDCWGNKTQFTMRHDGRRWPSWAHRALSFSCSEEPKALLAIIDEIERSVQKVAHKEAIPYAYSMRDIKMFLNGEVGCDTIQSEA